MPRNPLPSKLWDGHIAIKESLWHAEVSKSFGDTDATELLAAILPPHIFDAHYPTANQAVYVLKDCGIFNRITVASMKQKIKDELRPTLEQCSKQHKALWNDIAN